MATRQIKDPKPDPNFFCSIADKCNVKDKETCAYCLERKIDMLEWKKEEE